MHRVVITAQVDDAVKWEELFRTRGELFRRQTVKTVHFTVPETNQATICFYVDDLDTYMQILESAETAEAMAQDGVHRDTVKVSVLDKEFQP